MTGPDRADRPGHPGRIVSASGRVHAAPPGPGTPYWRLSVHDATGHRIRQTSGGRTRASAAARLEQLERAATGAPLPAATARTVGDLLDFYRDERRVKFGGGGRPRRVWSPRYQHDVDALIDREVRPCLGHLPLGALGAADLYRLYDTCPTNAQVTKLRRLMSAVSHLGVDHGLLRPDQAMLYRTPVPLRPDTGPPRPGPAPARGDLLLLAAHEVPTPAQVAALAAAGDTAGIPCRQWAGAVDVLAFGGLRVGELLALTADAVLPDRPQLLDVSWQVVEVPGHGQLLTPPKSGLSRLASVPPPVWQWLLDRAAQARAEQREGANPRSLLVPAPDGGWWWQGNLRNRCFVPAAERAGWPRLSWRGPVRRRVRGRWTSAVRERHHYRHTLHSLRHFYATTARDVWGWTGAELCANGGWADQAFVLARYYGASAAVYRSAAAKQAAQPGYVEVGA